MLKKLGVIAVIAMFLLTGLTTSLAISQKSSSTVKVEKTKVTVKEVNFCRCGPNGNIETFKLNIEVKDGEDISRAIRKKCKELFEEDEEIQRFIDQNQEKIKVLLTMGAWGGLPVFLSNLAFKFPAMSGPQNPNLLPSILFIAYREPLIPRIWTINTTFFDLVPFGDNKTTVTGPHIIIAMPFIGFTTWYGWFSWNGLLTGMTMAIGLAMYIKTIQPGI